MLAFSVFSLLPLFASAQQQCADGGIGLCVGDICPSGFTCLDDNLPTENCCNNSLIYVPTTPPPTTIPPTAPPAQTTASPSTCVDKLNPLTGISDCPYRTQYCQNAIYFDLMTDQCPKTCNRCSTGNSNCVDKLNPSTGTSDCPGMASYCTNARYYDLMTDQCPKTCGRCPTSSNGNTGSSNNCVDKINPSTGTSDCPFRTELCNDQTYYELMTEQCPKTCARCSASSGTSSGSSTTNTQSSTCVDKINPSTGSSDCPGMASYCNNGDYYTLMTDQCPKTCGRCSG